MAVKRSQVRKSVCLVPGKAFTEKAEILNTSDGPTELSEVLWFRIDSRNFMLVSLFVVVGLGPRQFE